MGVFTVVEVSETFEKRREMGKKILRSKVRRRIEMVVYFSFSSLLSSLIKVSISLNWRYTEAKRT